MERIITMSTKELDRAEVFSRLQQKVISQTQAADILGITTRHARRLFSKYKEQGALALISKKRGKPSNHQLRRGLKDLVLALIKEHYQDFGPTLTHEKIVEVHHIKLSVWTVRRLMIEHDLWAAKKVKKKRVYQLRERRKQEGELVQTDGSPHDWFEGRGPKCSLLHCIDDATGKIKAALFAPSETVWSYFDLMQNYIKAHGRPRALYNDKHAVFRVNKTGALSGNGLTQFGRAVKALDIEMIYANSPQAKGRIERSNRTLQDRLVKELRLNKISTIEAANAFLPKFIEDYNRRFAVIPKDPNNAHRPLLREQNIDLIFTIKEFRYLSKNLTFQYKNVIYQIRTEREAYALRKAKVALHEKKDGSLEVFYRDNPLAFTAYSPQEKQGEIIDAKTLNEVLDNLQKRQEEAKQVYKPSYNHPWKRGARKRLFAKSAPFQTAC